MTCPSKSVKLTWFTYDLEPDLDWKPRKKNTDRSLEENPKDDNSILWRGSLKVAIGKENAGEILYPLEENIFPLKDGHS
ncbi:hypothetical protein Avbf_00735 [Armadillidium vulgare]|nr:hypothetical protein Avbf_00735 [Armadillidium vulgare]